MSNLTMVTNAKVCLDFKLCAELVVKTILWTLRSSGKFHKNEIWRFCFKFPYHLLNWIYTNIHLILIFFLLSGLVSSKFQSPSDYYLLFSTKILTYSLYKKKNWVSNFSWRHFNVSIIIFFNYWILCACLQINCMNIGSNLLM